MTADGVKNQISSAVDEMAYPSGEIERKKGRRSS